MKHVVRACSFEEARSLGLGMALSACDIDRAHALGQTDPARVNGVARPHDWYAEQHLGQATAAREYGSLFVWISRPRLKTSPLSGSGYSGYPPGTVPGTCKCRITPHWGCVFSRGCGMAIW